MINLKNIDTQMIKLKIMDTKFIIKLENIDTYKFMIKLKNTDTHKFMIKLKNTYTQKVYDKIKKYIYTKSL